MDEMDDEDREAPIISRHDRLNGIIDLTEKVNGFTDTSEGLRQTMGMQQYDKALLGYYYVPQRDESDEGGYRAVYSMQGIVDCLCEDMTTEDALEHFEYNIAGSLVDSEDVYKDTSKPLMPLIISIFPEDV
jgi:hypothetical protein